MSRSFPWQLEVLGLIGVAVAVSLAGRVRAVDEKPTPVARFSQPTIDIGCFVSDPEASVKFYTEALGFTELSPFSVPGDFCKEVGLTSGEALDNIRVVVLGEGAAATRLKFSSVPGQQARTADNSSVPAQYGFRYITIHVADQTAALKRLEKAGVKPLGNGPALLPKSLGEGVYLTCVRDPDGNLVELLGPRK